MTFLFFFFFFNFLIFVFNALDLSNHNTKKQIKWQNRKDFKHNQCGSSNINCFYVVLQMIIFNAHTNSPHWLPRTISISSFGRSYLNIKAICLLVTIFSYVFENVL